MKKKLLNTPRIVEDRIGIGMIENRKGLESMGVRAWEWAGKVLGNFLESSWKVLGFFGGEGLGCCELGQ